MEFHLNRRIRFDGESEYKSLYSWSLQEISETGEQIGLNQVPWPWDFVFSASELRYINRLRIERSRDTSDAPPSEDKDDATEFIVATLQSGSIGIDGTWAREASFSMFGTDREIHDFSLEITPSDGDRPQVGCSVWGSVGYTYENDFRTYTRDDSIQISVVVSIEQFRALGDLISKAQPHDFGIRLGGVAGFYSEWSPSISTNRVKILTSGSEHEVEMSDGYAAKIRRLGQVSVFELNAMLRIPLASKPNSGFLDAERGDGDAKERDRCQREVAELRDVFVAQLGKRQNALDRLKWPIWLILILLMLLYFK